MFMGSFTLYYIWSGQPEQFIIPQHVSKHKQLSHTIMLLFFLVSVCISICCIHHFCLLLLSDHLVQQIPSLQYHDCILAYAGN